MAQNFTQKDIADTMNSFQSYTDHDLKNVMENRKKIESIAQNDSLSQYLNDIKLYFQMIGDTLTGEYKQVPFGTIAAIVGTLLYLLSPIDLIPDFIPVIGFLDDAAVLGACLKLTRFDVAQYKKYLKAKKR